jgi:hypothetical protein
LTSLAIVVLAIWLYDNNHVLMPIFAIFGFILFLMIGEAELKIYPDRIDYSRNSIFPLSSSRKVFLINTIKTFTITGSSDVSTDINNDLTTPDEFYESEPYNGIEIGFKDGTTVNIETRIYINKLKNASVIIHSMINVP